MTWSWYRPSTCASVMRAPATAAIAVGGLLAVSALAGMPGGPTADSRDLVTQLEPDPGGDTLVPPDLFAETERDDRTPSIPLPWSQAAPRASAIPMAAIAPRRGWAR